MIKMNWLAASVSLRAGGAAFLVIFSAVGLQFASSASQWEASASGRRNLSNADVQ
jgi:hypothetical protein